jgi:copper chaperone
MSTTTYQVTGMTCGHCVSPVTSEVSAVDGVTDVQVDLATGAVIVTSNQSLDDARIHAAIEEAGYQVTF